jgi:hypothetical protein
MNMFSYFNFEVQPWLGGKQTLELTNSLVRPRIIEVELEVLFSFFNGRA